MGPSPVWLTWRLAHLYRLGLRRDAPACGW